MENLTNLLKGNFWIIPNNLSLIEISFLSIFFKIEKEEIYDENKEILKQFYVLEKKEKYLPCRHF
jgi:hypothetical protein